MSQFQIKTEIFEGPLDLLLSLVEKRKLLINDISLATVTDDYLAYIERLPHMTIASRAEFVLVASTLLLIKSASLLSTIELTEEESSSIEDLEMRLKILQLIKEGGEHIRLAFGRETLFAAEGNSEHVKVFSPHKSITLDAVASSLASVIQRFPKVEKLQKAVVKQVISLEEMMDRLSQKIKSSLSMSFRQFSGRGETVSKEQKVEVIVSFLAMLELVKQGMIDCMQDKLFEDIRMETTEAPSVPRY